MGSEHTGTQGPGVVGRQQFPLGRACPSSQPRSTAPPSLAVPSWGSCLRGPHLGQTPGRPWASRPQPSLLVYSPTLSTAVPALIIKATLSIPVLALWHHEQPGGGMYQETCRRGQMTEQMLVCLL